MGRKGSEVGAGGEEVGLRSSGGAIFRQPSVFSRRIRARAMRSFFTLPTRGAERRETQELAKLPERLAKPPDAP